MTFQEAVTALAIFKGMTLPKASNHDKPERRVDRMIEKGWVVAGGAALTAKGYADLAEYGAREGWHPDTIKLLRDAVQSGALAAAANPPTADDPGGPAAIARRRP